VPGVPRQRLQGRNPLPLHLQPRPVLLDVVIKLNLRALSKDM
jgi:hypothetical protein